MPAGHRRGIDQRWHRRGRRRIRKHRERLGRDLSDAKVDFFQDVNVGLLPVEGWSLY